MNQDKKGRSITFLARSLPFLCLKKINIVRHKLFGSNHLWFSKLFFLKMHSLFHRKADDTTTNVQVKHNKNNNKMTNTDFNTNTNEKRLRSCSFSLKDNNESFHIQDKVFHKSMDMVAMTPRQNKSNQSKHFDISSIMFVSSTRSPLSRPALVSPLPPLFLEDLEGAKTPMKKRKNIIKNKFPPILGLDDQFSLEIPSNRFGKEIVSNLKPKRKSNVEDDSRLDYTHEKDDDTNQSTMMKQKNSCFDEIREKEKQKKRNKLDDDDSDAVSRSAASILCLLKSAILPTSFTLDGCTIFENLVDGNFPNIQNGQNESDTISKFEKVESFFPHLQLSCGGQSKVCHQYFPTRLALPQDSQELNSLHCFVRSHLLELFIVHHHHEKEFSNENKPSSIVEKGEDDSDDYNVEENDSDSEKNYGSSYKCSSHSDHNGIVSSILSEQQQQQQQQQQQSNHIYNSKNGNKANITCSTRLFPGRVGLRCLYCGHIPRKAVFGKASMSTFYPKSLADLYRSVCTWQRVHFRSCRHIPSDIKDKYWSLKDSDRSRGKTKYWVTSAREIGLVDSDGIEGKGGVCFA